MIKHLLSGLSALLVCACQNSTGTASDHDAEAYAAAMALADPAAMRLERSCMLQTPKTTFTTALVEDVFDGRYIYAKRTGRDNGYLVEFSDTCRKAQRGVTPHIEDICRRDWLRVRGELCVVQDIYRVPDESVGRALALKLEQERNRAALHRSIPTRDAAKPARTNNSTGDE
ncbi:hypothetical protein D1227_15970 [Henriciella mobilis]|nr:hypothetical protein D1231_16070 [Henriciella mobilis]RIJ19883.1 hypothetical protein D1227_15970 [Henriciella mobilis]